MADPTAEALVTSTTNEDVAPERTRPLVTIGEALVCLSSTRPGPLETQPTLTVSTGGAEANVAICVRRLGRPAHWIGRIGDDPFGRLIITTLAGQGVIAHPVLDNAPTSLMLREKRTADIDEVHYYRREGPGAHLAPGDVDDALIASAAALHITGITPALSPSATATILHAAKTARQHDVPVSFDVNYRSRLWPPDQAASTLRDLAEHADLIFAGPEEAALLGCNGSPEKMATELRNRGAAVAVIKLGADGAHAVADGYVATRPALPITAVDPVGAGDAFVAGFLADYVDDRDPDECLTTALICGAYAASTIGDWEGQPSRSEIERLLNDKDRVRR